MTSMFEFTKENMAQIQEILKKYPAEQKQSAVMPLLDLAQRQNGNYLSVEAMDEVARFLEMPAIRVYEVASFYTMYNREKVGEHFIQICKTTPCWLCGSDKITKSICDHLGIESGQTTDDGKFTVKEVECLGACVNAPMIQINDDYFEDLTPENVTQLLDDLKAGKKVKTGSLTGRQTSCPKDGPTTLNSKTQKKSAR